MGYNQGKVNLNPSDHVSKLNDPTFAIRQLANETKHVSQTATGDFAANLAPAADPRLSHLHYATSLNNTGRIVAGEIVDGTATANAYIVKSELLRAPAIAIALSTTSQAPLGPTEIYAFAPGTRVLLYLHNQEDTLLILGAIPTRAVIGKESVHDFITQASRKRVDEAHKRYLKLVDSSGIPNCSTWRPFDQTQGGEWGAITTTGAKITLDDFMVQAAINEFCGVFAFYHDQMLRLSGYGLQVWTAGHEREAVMDEAEYNDYQGYTAYPWENMGMLEPGQNLIEEYSSNVFAKAAGRPYYTHWEPKYDNLLPFHRTQYFHGYYGQGGRAIVCAPPPDQKWWTSKYKAGGDPPDPYESTVQNKRGGVTEAEKGAAKQSAPDEEKPCVGLHEDNTGMDGRRFIASAKGITLAKRVLIPVPSRRRRPEDPEGDNTAKNYKAAGKYGSGEGTEHKITGDIKATAKNPHMQRAAGILDLHAYLFNYAGLHPFHWHHEDYKTWEQSELKHGDDFEYLMALPDYTALKGSMYLPQPDPKSIKVDERYNKQNFYQTESFISLLEDGAIVIGDGYGSEIRMCAGTITISAPGDVWLKPGKNAQVWAGRDCIVRANGAVELSTTEKDVRIKSERNLLMLAGNKESGTGGVLIESRSDQILCDFENAGENINFGGVILRAPKSNVVGIGHHIYMRSGGGNNKVKPGDITLDAGKGANKIITKSNQIFNYVDANGSISNFFGLAATGQAQVAHYFAKNTVLLSGFLYATKQIFAGKGLLSDAYVYARSAIVGMPPRVLPCTGECPSELNRARSELDSYVYQTLPQIARQFHADYLDNLWYGDKRAGNDRVMDIMEFSFRKDDEYRVEGFELFEDRWQQYARLGGQDTGKWEEKPVKQSVSPGETWPFPGKAKLNDEQVFIKQDFNMQEVSGKKFRNKDRGSADGKLEAVYENPEFKDTDKTTIKEGYMIVK